MRCISPSLSYGLLGYPILQAADILLLKGDVVPVGPDHVAHGELAREFARGFNEHFMPVFPVPAGLAPDSGTLPGIDGSPKMSRSVGNTINLFDAPEVVRTKVVSMYTDPARLHATDPGHVEGNPVFAYHDAFNPDTDEVADLKHRCIARQVGDVEVKQRLVAALESFLDPIRQRRSDLLAENPSIVEDVLRTGTARARNEAPRPSDRFERPCTLTTLRRGSRGAAKGKPGTLPPRPCPSWLLRSLSVASARDLNAPRNSRAPETAAQLCAASPRKTAGRMPPCR